MRYISAVTKHRYINVLLFNLSNNIFSIHIWFCWHIKCVVSRHIQAYQCKWESFYFSTFLITLIYSFCNKIGFFIWCLLCFSLTDIDLVLLKNYSSWTIKWVAWIKTKLSIHNSGSESTGLHQRQIKDRNLFQRCSTITRLWKDHMPKTANYYCNNNLFLLYKISLQLFSNTSVHRSVCQYEGNKNSQVKWALFLINHHTNLILLKHTDVLMSYSIPIY